jgi:hypothetical protein
MEASGIARRRRAGRLLAAAVGVGLGLCAATLLISGQRPAGTGTHQWRGFPQPYVFSWRDFAGEEIRWGANAFYLVQNWAIWTAVAAAVLLLVRRLRAPRGTR